MADLLILGGGPAGAATALAARAGGLEVDLVEAARPPVRKVCGEFLSEPGFQEWIRLSGAPADRHPRITRVVFARGARGGRMELALQPAAYGVRRETLDEELLRAAVRAGVRVWRGVRAGRPSAAGAARWQVDLRPDSPRSDTPPALTAHRIVRATGRSVDPTGEWFGVRGPATPGGPPDLLEMTLLPDGSYYGRSAVDGGGSCLCGLSRSDRAPWAGHAPPGTDAVLFGTARFRPGLQKPDPDGHLAVGDALAAWPPLVGDGMTVALLSGGLLGRALACDPSLAGDAWRRLWWEHFGGAMRRTLWLHRVATSRRWGGMAFGLLAAFPAGVRRLARSVRQHPCACALCFGRGSDQK